MKSNFIFVAVASTAIHQEVAQEDWQLKLHSNSGVDLGAQSWPAGVELGVVDGQLDTS
jgi:hypothetical protein